MLKKITLMSVIAICSMPLMAQADDLVINNTTDFFSTSVINNGSCSTILGETGITKPRSVNTVSSKTVKLACLFNQANCKADVYMTNNCTGPVIATAVLDTSKGIKSVEMKDAKFKVGYAGFNITITYVPGEKDVKLLDVVPIDQGNK